MSDVSRLMPLRLTVTEAAFRRRALITIALGWMVVVLALPLALVFATAFGDGVTAFWTALTTPAFLHAALLTTIAAVTALVFNIVFGVAAAWAIARTSLPGRGLMATLLDLPVAVSPVIAGLMFLLLFGRQGWFAPIVSATGIQVVFALPGILIATVFVTMPFVAKEVIAVLEETGTAQEEAASTLGASPWQVFAHVVVPNIRWAVFYGSVLTLARAVGEFGAVSVLSGNLVGKTQTLPLYIERTYTSYQTQAAFSAAVPLTMLAVLTIAAQLLLSRISARRRQPLTAEETAS